MVKMGLTTLVEKDTKVMTVHDAILNDYKYFDIARDQGHIKLSPEALCLLIRVRNERSLTNKTGDLPGKVGDRKDLRFLLRLLEVRPN